MDDEKRNELRHLTGEERRRRLEAGLGLHRSQRDKVEKANERQHALRALAPVLSAMRELTGREPNILWDDAEIVAWIPQNFPFPFPVGTTCDWSSVPNSISILAPDSETAVWALGELFQHVHAHEDDEVYVLWHVTFLPTLRMPLSLCRLILPALLAVPGQEMHLASPRDCWYIEFDPFLNAVNGGNVHGEAPR